MPGPYQNEGQDITVEAFLRQPDLVLHRMLDLADQGFIVDALLQEGYDASSGQVAYTRSESLYLDGDPEEIPEAGEYPIIGPTDLTRLVEFAKKHGLKTFITEETIRHSVFPEVEKALVKLKNTIVRYVDGLFLNKLITDPAIQTRAAAGPWTNISTNQTIDVERSRGDIRNVNMGYEGDTIVIHSSRLADLTANERLGDAYRGNMANQNPLFTGHVGNIWGMDIMHTPNLPSTNTALILQRKMIGGIADEIPLQAKTLPFNEDNDTAWVKGRRISATFLTDPKAAVLLQGI